MKFVIRNFETGLFLDGLFGPRPTCGATAPTNAYSYSSHASAVDTAKRVSDSEVCWLADSGEVFPCV